LLCNFNPIMYIIQTHPLWTINSHESSIWPKKKTTKLYSIKTYNTNSTKKILFLQKSLPQLLSSPFQRTKRNPNSRVSELKKPKKTHLRHKKGCIMPSSSSDCGHFSSSTCHCAPKSATAKFPNKQIQGRNTNNKSGQKTNKRDANVESRCLNPKP